MSSNLVQIIAKLGHPLVEIRTRALRSIEFKLHHGLISANELLFGRTIIKRLLEWFNFENVPNKLEVLLLLSHLLKADGTVPYFKQIGGMEFLLSLKNNVPQNLVIVIDEIIENISRNILIEDQSPIICESSSSVQSTEERSLSQYKTCLTKCLEETPKQNIKNEKFIKINFFPWLPLCKQDKHVLVSIEKLLTKEDIDLQTACNVFSHVALQDYPAEIFISRPKLIKILLDRLMPTKSSSSATLEPILTSLNIFVTHLQSRVQSFLDISSLSCKDSFLTTHKVSHKNNQEDINDLINSDLIRDKPMSIVEFILTTLTRSFPLFGLIASKTISSLLLSLSEKTIKLFQIVLVSPQLLWESSCSLGQQITSKLVSLADIIGRALEKFKKSPISNETTVRFYRMMFLHLICLLDRFLDNFWPSEYYNRLSASVIQAFLYAVNDEFIAFSIPSVRQRGLKIIEANMLSEMRNLKDIDEIIDSFKATWKFQTLFTDDNIPLSRLISLAEHSLLSHSFHQHSEYISNIFDFSSVFHSTKNCNSELGGRLKTIIGFLLTSPCGQTREMSYKKCLSIAENSLGPEIGNVTQSSNIRFLADFEILREICFSAFECEEKEIVNIARKILTLLTQSDLVISPTVLSTLLPIIWELMPIIQSSTEAETELLENIFYHFCNEDKTNSFLPLIRYSFSIYSKIRNRAHETLFLILNDKRQYEEPIDMEKIFIRQYQEVHHYDPSELVYGEADINELYRIFVDETKDIELRTAAVNQMAIYLKNSTKHPLFISLDGVSNAVNCLKSTEFLHDQINIWKVRSQTTLLFEFLNADETNLRIELSKDIKLVISTIKLLFSLSSVDGYSANRTSELLIKLIQLLSFSQIHNLYNPDRPHKFTVPQSVGRRFKLHLKGEFIEYKPYFSSNFPLPCEVMTDNVISARLRIVWNLEKVGSFEKLSNLAENKNLLNEGILTMTTEDIEWITGSITENMIDTNLNKINEAKTHKQVIDSIGELFLATTTVYSQKICKNWFESFIRFMTILPSSEADNFLIQLIFKFLIHQLRTEMPQIFEIDDVEKIFTFFLTAEIDDDLCLEVLLALQEVLKRSKKFQKTENNYSRFNDIFMLLLDRLRTCSDKHKIHETEKIVEIMSLMTTDMIHLTVDDSLYSVSLILNIIIKFIDHKGGNYYSYISNGILRYSTYSILHILVNLESDSESYVEMINVLSHDSLSWILSLWNCRDQQIRCASYGIGVVITAGSEGQKELASACFSLGSIWNACLTIISDSFESSIVRQQAVNILENMIISCEPDDHGFQSPVFRDEYDKCIFGFDALYSIMKRMNFMDLIDTLLENCVLPWKNITSIDYESFASPEQLYNDEFLCFTKYANSDPLLLGSICRLLGTLINQSPEMFEKYIPFDFLNSIISILNNTNYMENAPIESLNLHIQLMNDVLNLLSLILTFYPRFIDSILQNDFFVKNVLELLKVKDVNLKDHITDSIIGSIFQFFHTFTEIEGVRSWCVLDVMLIPKLELIFDCIHQNLSNSVYFAQTMRFVYAFIKHVYSVATSGYQEFLKYFEDSATTSNSWKCIITSILIPHFEEFYAKPKKMESKGEASQLVYGSLKLIFGFSQISCKIAFEDKFVEKLIEYIILLINHLTVENLQVKSRKIAILNSNLTAIINILQNMLYNSDYIQNSLLDMSCVSLIIELWDRSLLYEPLLQSLLGMMMNYSFRNSHCANSLSIYGGNSNDVCCVSLCVQLVRKTRYDDWGKDYIWTCFKLLANISTNQNCRIVIKKAGLMDLFYVNFNRFVKNKSFTMFERLWIDLIRNISFFKDGLSIIIRDNSNFNSKDIVGFLINCGLGISADQSDKNIINIALIIRNICFVNNIKIILLSLDDFFTLLHRWLSIADIAVQTVACCIIMHVGYKTHKIKSLLKTKGIDLALRKTHELCSNEHLNEKLCLIINCLEC